MSSPPPITTKANRQKLEFDKKLKQIENDELRLLALEQELLLLQSRVATESIPLVEEFCELRFKNLTKLQQHLADSYFKKKDKRQIIHLMTELALGLQSVGDSRAEAFLDEIVAEEDEFVEEKDKGVEAHKFKPAEQVEKLKEGKLEIKSLFRELAKAFHPDKEILEHLKVEKTSLMQKITAAYENQDLYGLLKLEKEHLGPREFSEDKIELYTKHINDRLKELKSFEARLKKYGSLATIYRFIYSKKVTILEYNIRNELSKIENEVLKEKELQQILWDKFSLLNFFMN
ncbi:MAG: J domain-containing protein [Bacteriovorax sp.]|nr:J domain-containing protein [Bacteriovorax sp.]